MFEIGTIATRYLVVTLLVGIYAGLHEKKFIIGSWILIFMSWIGTILINDNISATYKHLGLSIMDGALVSLFVLLARHTHFMWIAVMAVIHIGMVCLHLLGHFAIISNHQLVYNYMYCSALFTMVMASGERSAGILDRWVMHLNPRWTFANPLTRYDQHYI